MDDLISRQATYDTLTDYYHHTTDIQHKALCDALSRVPSAQPDLSDYSDKLWAAAYERGKAEAVRWIPCSEQPAEPNSLACDKFGQVFITLTVVDINGKCYDGTEVAFNVEEFLKGKLIGDGVRVLPTEIIAWMPLPEPYKEGD